MRFMNSKRSSLLLVFCTLALSPLAHGGIEELRQQQQQYQAQLQELDTKISHLTQSDDYLADEVEQLRRARETLLELTAKVDEDIKNEPQNCPSPNAFESNGHESTDPNEALSREARKRHTLKRLKARLLVLQTQRSTTT